MKKFLCVIWLVIVIFICFLIPVVYGAEGESKDGVSEDGVYEVTYEYTVDGEDVSIHDFIQIEGLEGLADKDDLFSVKSELIDAKTGSVIAYNTLDGVKLPETPEDVFTWSPDLLLVGFCVSFLILVFIWASITSKLNPLRSGISQEENSEPEDTSIGTIQDLETVSTRPFEKGKTRCAFCGSKIKLIDSNCSNCGAPNLH